MKRKDIVAKLIGEGLSEKFLASMDDKQLNMLAERVIPEQMTVPSSIPNVSKTDTKTITTLKQEKKPFSTYEGELKEDSDEKEKTIKKLKFKIEHEKDKGKVADAKKLLAKLENKKEESLDERSRPGGKNSGVRGGSMGWGKGTKNGKPKPLKETEIAEGEFKSKTEWLKSKGIIKDDDKKEETTEDSDTAEATPEHKKEKSEKKEKGTKGGGGAEYEKRLAKGNLGFGLNEWVSKVVGKNIHPFTSKNEIMELIKVKLTEQRPQEAPRPTDPDIDVEPGKREAPGIDPDDPFRDPHPGIDPNPKAKKKHKISAEDAKNKILDLLKNEL